jgi:hypothetical protein
MVCDFQWSVDIVPNSCTGDYYFIKIGNDLAKLGIASCG